MTIREERMHVCVFTRHERNACVCALRLLAHMQKYPATYGDLLNAVVEGQYDDEEFPNAEVRALAQRMERGQ